MGYKRITGGYGLGGYSLGGHSAQPPDLDLINHLSGGLQSGGWEATVWGATVRSHQIWI